MKLSELWLREWVDPPLTSAQLASQLTMAGLEVEGLHPVAGVFDKVIVAKVHATFPHPNADKLTLCEVDVGHGDRLQVVCGASNVRPQLNVALACNGARLPGGLVIKESKLRGERSQGMLCSATELGLMDESEGILELPENAPLGMDLREYLSLNDVVIEIDLTPNRADCFSILGIAREVAALNQLPLRTLPNTICTEMTAAILPVHVMAKEACPSYCGRLITGINSHAETPIWIKERLRRGGIRSIHPVVDVTNYVMLELGQPMHAFDKRAIENGITVRYANRDETLLLLNNQTVELDPSVLLIASENKPVAMAGIMGAMSSAVELDTVDIFLESAFFSPLVIGGSARRYGLFSDSSQRYERGVDPALQVRALARATELLHAIVGGDIGPVIQVQQAALPSLKTIIFKPEHVLRLTGVSIPYEKMRAILNHLGMDVEMEKTHWKVTVPSHRFDILLDVDLVEEIIRIYGYDNINMLPFNAPLRHGIIHPLEERHRQILTFLHGRGYHQTISYSFTDPALQQAIHPDKEALSLLNPISSELSTMRVSLWPGLLASMLHNIHRQQTAMKLFECGTVFNVQSGHLKEQPAVAGLWTGDEGALNWIESTRSCDFYDIKGDLEVLFATLSLENMHFVAGEHAALHPGKTACIHRGDSIIGWVGELHPQLMDAFDLVGNVFLFELLVDPLLKKREHRYHPISKYPQIRRDLSLIMEETISASDIERVVYEVVPAHWLKSFDIFDVYKGESIPPSKKSLAIALTLQDDSRTLIDEEINRTIDTLLKTLNNEFAILLRE